MAFLNAAGAPVAMAPLSIQLKLPCEMAVAACLAPPDLGAISLATAVLMPAVATGNLSAMETAIQGAVDSLCALWTNASGNPVAMRTVMMQIDLPAEKAARIGAPNWPAVLGAAIQLVIALMTSNPAAIAVAIQALIKAVMGG